MKNQAFTLIELLVVVLIIGILAAIAVPQYQLAVGKSKFSTIKNMTKAIAEAQEVYFLTNGKHTGNFANLDIAKQDNISCMIWADEGKQQAIACSTFVNNITMRYYQFLRNDPYLPMGTRICAVFSADKNNIPNKICQQETGKTADQASCDGNYCDYKY